MKNGKTNKFASI